MNKSTSEIQLIERILQGDVPAQKSLYLMYRVNWYKISLRYSNNKSEAEDILQEGLINIYNDLHQYDSKRSKFITWSSRIVVNSALRFHKKNAWNNTFSDIDQAYEYSDENISVYEYLAEQELIEILQLLPTGYRVIFNMYVIEGYTHKEISQQLSISEGTSKSQLSKARKLLQKKLESHLLIKRS